MPLPRIYPYQPTGSQPRRSKLPSFTPLIHGDNHTVISNTGTVYNNNNNDNWKDVDDEGNSKDELDLIFSRMKDDSNHSPRYY